MSTGGVGCAKLILARPFVLEGGLLGTTSVTSQWRIGDAVAFEGEGASRSTTAHSIHNDKHKGRLEWELTAKLRRQMAQMATNSSKIQSLQSVRASSTPEHSTYASKETASPSTHMNRTYESNI